MEQAVEDIDLNLRRGFGSPDGQRRELEAMGFGFFQNEAKDIQIAKRGPRECFE